MTRLASLQSDLRRAVANTKRGKRATGEQQRDILRKVEALEALDPTPNPVQSELLSGRWSLLYTGAAAGYFVHASACTIRAWMAATCHVALWQLPPRNNRHA